MKLNFGFSRTETVIEGIVIENDTKDSGKTYLVW